jgi:AraC family transcriptional regulator of arabinose operon
MNALEEALIWAYREISDEELRSADPRVRRAAHFLASDPSKPFNLLTLARQCGLSASRLSHLFKRDLQTTPQRFSEKIRLDLAEQLLSQTNLSVAEVAHETGFSDPLYFSRRFRQIRGRRASSFRARPERLV